MKLFLQEYIHKGILAALSMKIYTYNLSPQRTHDVYGKLVINVQYIRGLGFDGHKYFFSLPPAFVKSASTSQCYGDKKKTGYILGKYKEWMLYQNLF